MPGRPAERHGAIMLVLLDSQMKAGFLEQLRLAAHVIAFQISPSEPSGLAVKPWSMVQSLRQAVMSGRETLAAHRHKPPQQERHLQDQTHSAVCKRTRLSV